MQHRNFCHALGGLLIACSAISASAADNTLGYKDTPLVPGQSWHVHDSDRPRPKVVNSGATFSHNAAPPADATILFNGTDLAAWKNDKGAAAAWKVENGYMEVAPKSGNITTREEFGDFQLHLEFATPAVVTGKGQGRGNSGIFLHGLYEMQVLDSYENPTYADGQVGALYGQYPPLANPVKKPGEWQTYDILFEGPRFDKEGNLIKKAAVTAILNGVVVQNHREYLGPTKHKEATNYSAVKSSRGPISLQDHGNPMRFRNIWVRPIGEIDQP